MKKIKASDELINFIDENFNGYCGYFTFSHVITFDLLSNEIIIQTKDEVENQEIRERIKNRK